MYIYICRLISSNILHPYCWLEWNTFQRFQGSTFCVVASLTKSSCKLVTQSHKALQTTRVCKQPHCLSHRGCLDRRLCDLVAGKWPTVRTLRHGILGKFPFREKPEPPGPSAGTVVDCCSVEVLQVRHSKHKLHSIWTEHRIDA